MQTFELLHIGFLSSLLLGVLGACFLEPRGRREGVAVVFFGLFLSAVVEAYLGLWLRGPQGWPWDAGPLPYSPSIWGSPWPARGWIGAALLVVSLALTLGGLVLLGLRWSAVQAARNGIESFGESHRWRQAPRVSLLLLSGGLLLAWPTWFTIALWWVLLVVLATTRWRVPGEPQEPTAGSPAGDSVQVVKPSTSGGRPR